MSTAEDRKEHKQERVTASTLARLAYRPGYTFVVQGNQDLEIESSLSIPDASDSAHVISDMWTDPAPDLYPAQALIRCALATALHASIHEVLEWFSLDDTRLVDAHNDRVDAVVREASEHLAHWCWRNRARFPGHARR